LSKDNAYRPLKGLKVLDLSRVIAGPFAGQTLADLGAEVLKVERTDEGDAVRYVGPPWLKNVKGAEIPSTYFLSVNRGKRSICADFRDLDDVQLIRELSREADILIENYRTGTLDHFGLGYRDLSKINPRLIMCSVTGFGQTGPRSGESGYDYLAQAMSGIMDVTGHPPGEPGEGPMRVGIPLVDIFAAKDAVIALLTAVIARQATGKGQHVDISLFDSAIGAMLNPMSATMNGDQPIQRAGNIHPSAYPYGVFSTADGEILIATFTNSGFGGICDTVGHPEWKTDPRFDEPRKRVQNKEVLGEMLVPILLQYGRDYWIPRFHANKVSCGPINTATEALQDPQVDARKLIVKTDHATLGTIYGIRFPASFSEGLAQTTVAPPLIGEHNEAVREEFVASHAEAKRQTRHE
jgi:crotonobetainyl-CoA:carnitine CoA-transferase CaiB-like acyl-CoA transferase